MKIEALIKMFKEKSYASHSFSSYDVFDPNQPDVEILTMFVRTSLSVLATACMGACPHLCARAISSFPTKK